MQNTVQFGEIETLFRLGAHLGHKKNRLHPRARKHVYQIISGTSVIDLTATVKQLDAAKKYLREAAAEGKSVMVVGTKKTASSFIRSYCTEHGVPFIASKWLPGLLTNFKTLINNVKKLKEYEATLKDETNKAPKHERTKMQKDLSKLERLYGGIKHIIARPDILLIVDTKKEKNAVKEAHTFGIPIVGIADTNADPDDIAYPVVANDDTAEVVEYILTALIEAYQTPKA